MYAKNGVLQRLFVAFSRDSADKVYVQQHMQDAATDIAELLADSKHGHLYVCGDAKRMAKDVHSALVSILSSTSGMTKPAAEDKLKEWTSQDRYQRDIWYLLH